MPARPWPLVKSSELLDLEVWPCSEERLHVSTCKQLATQWPEVSSNRLQSGVKRHNCYVITFTTHINFILHKHTTKKYLADQTSKRDKKQKLSHGLFVAELSIFQFLRHFLGRLRRTSAQHDCSRQTVDSKLQQVFDHRYRMYKFTATLP